MMTTNWISDWIVRSVECEWLRIQYFKGCSCYFIHVTSFRGCSFSSPKIIKFLCVCVFLLWRKNRSFRKLCVRIMRIHHKNFVVQMLLTLILKCHWLVYVAWHTVFFQVKREGEWFFPLFIIPVFVFFFIWFAAILLLMLSGIFLCLEKKFHSPFLLSPSYIPIWMHFPRVQTHDRNSKHRRIIVTRGQKSVSQRYFHRRICYIIIIIKKTFTWH